MSLTTRLQQRYAVTGDVLAHDALTCIRALESALNELVVLIDPSERKHRSALRNTNALLTKLRNR